MRWYSLLPFYSSLKKEKNMEENIKTRRTGNIDSDLLEILIIEYRDNNLSLRKIQEKYNVNRHKVAKILEEKGIKTTKGNHYRYNLHDFDYFEIIDSHAKAYFLGLLMADGYITDNSKRYGEDKFGISLQIDDLPIIKSLKKHLKATNDIKTYTEYKGYSKDGGSTYARLILNSQKTVDDLIDKGVVKQKTLIKRFPSASKVPEEFVYSYLRGYMDGNGSIVLRKTKTQGLKGELSFTTSEYFAKSLERFGECSIYKDKRANAWYVSFYNKSSMKILNKMYEHSTEDTRIKRKYNKYLKIKNDE